MALLDMYMKKGFYLEVAHVNYHKRASAQRDEDTVFKYCQKHHLKFHKLDVYSEEVEGNFQAYARDRRYLFFKDICDKENLEAVLVAHHLDDLLETYFMQKERQLNVSYYGLKRNNIIKGVKVIRPLLSKTKKQLLDYCNKNNVSYGIDESNYSDDYERNRIRHELIDTMSLKEKKEVLKEIKELNRKITEELKIASSYINKEVYEYKEFLNIPYIERYLQNCFGHPSKDYLNEILRQLKESDKCHFEYEDMILEKEYGMIEYYRKSDEYHYVFNNIEEMYNFKCEYFSLKKKGTSVNGVTLSEDDFPVTVRTYRDGDFITMKYGTKKVNRFFIDHKILNMERSRWPLMFNAKNELILLPGLGCDLYHYSDKHQIFMVK